LGGWGASVRFSATAQAFSQTADRLGCSIHKDRFKVYRKCQSKTDEWSSIDKDRFKVYRKCQSKTDEWSSIDKDRFKVYHKCESKTDEWDNIFEKALKKQKILIRTRRNSKG
jgi:hypothetical protein